MNQSFLELTIGIDVLLIGFMLFFLNKKYPQSKNFVDSMSIVLVIFNVVGLSFPFLTQFPSAVYYFIPIYLSGAVGWLFFTQYFIIGIEKWWPNNWKNDINRKIIHVFLYLMLGFFVLIITLPILISKNPTWI